jgi:itaconyl-CoA hydratase
MMSQHAPSSADTAANAGETGLCYEDFEIGHIHQHRFGRTLTQHDNVTFSLLTLGLNQVHFNDDYASRTPYGKAIMPSPLTLAVVTGISAIDFGQNTMANLGWQEVTMPRPVFAGDTIYARSKVVEMRTSKSRPSTGIIAVVTEGYNQDGEIVMTFGRKFMVYRRGHTPAACLPKVKASADSVIARDAKPQGSAAAAR